jgi:hypothetical protein
VGLPQQNPNELPQTTRPTRQNENFTAPPSSIPRYPSRRYTGPTLPPAQSILALSSCPVRDWGKILAAATTSPRRALLVYHSAATTPRRPLHYHHSSPTTPLQPLLVDHNRTASLTLATASSMAEP